MLHRLVRDRQYKHQIDQIGGAGDRGLLVRAPRGIAEGQGEEDLRSGDRILPAKEGIRHGKDRIASRIAVQMRQSLGRLGAADGRPGRSRQDQRERQGIGRFDHRRGSRHLGESRDGRKESQQDQQKGIPDRGSAEVHRGKGSRGGGQTERMGFVRIQFDQIDQGDRPDVRLQIGFVHREHGDQIEIGGNRYRAELREFRLGREHLREGHEGDHRQVEPIRRAHARGRQLAD